LTPAVKRKAGERTRRSLQFFAAFVKRWASLLLVLAIVIPVTLQPPYDAYPPIRSDGFGYHIWTRALLQRDLNFCKYATYPGIISHTDVERGICQNKYPPGLALLRFPVMALLADLDPGAPAISHAEHQANLLLSALVLLAICLLGLNTARLLGADPWLAHAAVVAIVFGAGLFHYATFDSAFTHAYSALGAALLLFLGVRARLASRLLPIWLSGLTAFFLVSLRATNLLLLAALAAAYLSWARAGAGSVVSRRLADLRELAPLVAGAALAFGLQLTYNFYATGTFTLSSYGRERFHFDRPMQFSVLFSYERGLFTYFPVVAAVLLSAFAAPRTRRAAAWFTGLLLLYATTYGFWVSWMLGGGFGHRGFVELMPLATVLFAIALTELRRKVRRMVLALALASVFVTIELMVGYWSGTFPYSGAIAEIYWSHLVGPRSLPARVVETF